MKRSKFSEAQIGFVLKQAGVTHGRPKSEGMVSPTAHLFTPESKNCSHYWFSVAIPKSVGPEAQAQAQTDWLKGPFTDADVLTLEEQQENIGNREFRTLKIDWLPGDAAGARARKILYEKLDAEAATEANAQT